MLPSQALLVSVLCTLCSAASLNFVNVPSTVNWGDTVTISWTGGNSSNVRLWKWDDIVDSSGNFNGIELAPGGLPNTGNYLWTVFGNITPGPSHLEIYTVGDEANTKAQSNQFTVTNFTTTTTTTSTTSSTATSTTPSLIFATSTPTFTSSSGFTDILIPTSTSVLTSTSISSSASATSAPVPSSASSNPDATTTSSSSSSSSSSNSLPIGLGVGITLGVLLIAAAIAFYFYMRRRQRHRHQDPALEPMGRNYYPPGPTGPVMTSGTGIERYPNHEAYDPKAPQTYTPLQEMDATGLRDPVELPARR